MKRTGTREQKEGDWRGRGWKDGSRKGGTEKEIRGKLENGNRGREKEKGKGMGETERSKG